MARTGCALDVKGSLPLLYVEYIAVNIPVIDVLTAVNAVGGGIGSLTISDRVNRNKAKRRMRARVADRGSVCETSVVIRCSGMSLAVIFAVIEPDRLIWAVVRAMSVDR